ncbi:MAG: 3'-5' exonuclease [Candidatus Paceibacterota bacterium]|jgi:DNA polymerase III epsilon subunit-like protein
MENNKDIGKVARTLQGTESRVILFFDTETTGLPRSWNAPQSDLNNWPRIVQIAWVSCDLDGKEISRSSFIVRPEGFLIPREASLIHGITTERAAQEGTSLIGVLALFGQAIDQAECIVAHNISFDEMVAGAEFLRNNMPNNIPLKRRICTKEISTNFCAIPSANGFNGYKWPKLSELHTKLFGTEFKDSHSALNDADATARCFWEMRRRGII